VKRKLLSGVLVVILAGFAERGMDATAVGPSAEMKTQVFRYLDSTDEAARTLQAMLSDQMRSTGDTDHPNRAGLCPAADRDHSRRAS
jgi:hypothetical protein